MAEPQKAPQSDPWVEQAKNFQPTTQGETASAPASGNDDWKVWQQNAGVDNQPETIHGNFQKAFDELATPPKFDYEHPGMSAAQDFGAGVIGLMTPIFHPQKTLDTASKLLTGSTADKMSVLKPMARAFMEDPDAQALAQLPGLMAGGAGGAAEDAASDLGNAVERGGLNLGNDVLGAKGPKPFKYGANPARGAYEEGVLPALSRHSAAMALEKAIPNVGERISDKVMLGASQPSANLIPSVEKPITDAANVASGFGGGKPLDPIANLWASMEEKAPDASAPIYGKGAPTDVTAPDLWHSIRNLDKNTRFNPDPEVEGVNELRRDIRGGLRGNLEDAVPGLKPDSQRYGDLKSAEESLGRVMHGGMSFRKMMDLPMTAAESTVGKGMYSGGRAMQAAAPAAGMAMRSAPAATLMNDLRKKKEQ